MCEPVTLGAIAGTLTAGATGTAAGASALGMTSALSAVQAISLGATVGGAVMSGASMYQQSQTTKKQAEYNAQVAEMGAQDAVRRGEEEAMKVQRKGATLKSAQRAAFGGRGLDLGYGTAADIQDQTDFFTLSDMATTRSNAAKEAWNMRAQKRGYMGEGRADSLNALYRGSGSLLGGAGMVADKWYSYGPKFKTSFGGSLDSFFSGTGGSGD